ncbi:MAG: VCBS repeat-containing protein [Verrucomicrobiales bacterium]|nr:VCBS repeat-containing protein [Verrucomicrobiales bacterium]
MRRLAMVTIGVFLLAGGRGSAGWVRHAIDAGGSGKVGADGVRLGDVDGDGLLDVVSGWEQSGEVRIYRNPGSEAVEAAWPVVTVGKVPGVEDACFVDFDGDGVVDVLSCTEGKSRRVFLHRAPGESGRYFEAAAWQTAEVARGEMWMFAEVEAGIVYLGSKGAGAGVSRGVMAGGRLGLERLADAGWVMSLELVDLDGVGGSELLVTDRKGERRGVWEWSGARGMQRIGGAGREVMFADVGMLDGDGDPDVVVATRDGFWLVCERSGGDWRETVYPNPMGIRAGKAVAIGDIDLDGENDIVMSFNTQQQDKRPGVVWAKRRGEGWEATDVSGLEGKKFDLVELLDLDGDGDLDILTCEEADNLGVVWYENPLDPVGSGG